MKDSINFIKKKNTLFLFIFCLTILNINATDYYVDATNGNDSNNGTSTSTAWKTLVNINTTIFQPGDSILFKAGESWYGTIKPQGSGTSGNSIILGKYGSGNNPAIHGDATVNCTTKPGKTKFCTIYLNNQEYWEIRDLEITNYDSTEESGKSLEQWENDNITNYANVTKPAQYTGVNTEKCAILVEGNNMGAINSLHFINLEIHGVNGDISEKNNGGIYLEIYNYNSAHTPTYFDDLLFDNCYIHDVDRTGISNRSDYDNRTLNVNTDWTPSLNYIVRNCTFERTGANALIARIADGLLIENNLFTSCSIKGSGNAVFNFNTDNAVLRFNECRFTKYNVNDNDAGGIDSDYRTKNTTIEYNYIHDNDFGTLITGGPGNFSSPPFNDNTVFRYNILENDGILETEGYGAWAFKISGYATNTHVYNNVIYVGSSKSYTDIVYHKSWSGAEPDGSVYNNNIFYNDGSNTQFNITSSTNNTFSNNLFYGNTMLNEPSDANKVIQDPKFYNPGGGENGYKLASDSPALAMGKRLATTPNLDYYQNTILAEASIDIGVEQITQEFVAPINNNINVIEDAFVRGGENADVNFEDDSSQPLLLVKISPSNDSFSRQSFLKFDVSNYSSISSAILHLSGSQTNSGDSFKVTVSKVNDDTWSEDTITWNTMPAVSDAIGTFDTQALGNEVFLDYTVDVTEYIQEQLAGNKIASFNLSDLSSTNEQLKIEQKDVSGTPAYISITGNTLNVQNNTLSKFSISPNPVEDAFVLQMPNSKIENVTIFSIIGETLFTKNNVNANQITIDLKEFKTGVYLVYVKNSKGDLSVKKIIKK